MKPARVEFYVAQHARLYLGRAKALLPPSPAEYSWRLQAANGQTIISPHKTFDSHRAAVANFKRVCKAMDARGPWQIVDEPGMPTRKGSHQMIIAGKR